MKERRQLAPAKSFAHGYTSASIRVRKAGFERLYGYVETRHGMVGVTAITRGIRDFADGSSDWGPVTRLWFIHEGRIYIKDAASRILTARGAARFATRFAHDVAHGLVLEREQ